MEALINKIKEQEEQIQKLKQAAHKAEADKNKLFTAVMPIVTCEGLIEAIHAGFRHKTDRVVNAVSELYGGLWEAEQAYNLMNKIKSSN